MKVMEMILQRDIKIDDLFLAKGSKVTARKNDDDSYTVFSRYWIAVPKEYFEL
jgi:hypothetical protein